MHRLKFQFGTLLGLLFIGIVTVPIRTVVAQSNSGPRLEHRYQRWLPTPSSDLAESSKLLEQLRRDAETTPSNPVPPSRATNPSNRFETPRTEFTPQELEQIKKLAEQFIQKKNAPFNPSDLDRIPPELIQRFLSSPAIQEWARDLVQRNNLESSLPNMPGSLPSNNNQPASASPKIPNSISDKPSPNGPLNRYSRSSNTKDPRVDPNRAQQSDADNPNNATQNQRIPADDLAKEMAEPSAPNKPGTDESSRTSSQSRDNVLRENENNKGRAVDGQPRSPKTPLGKDDANGPSRQPTPPSTQKANENIWGEDTPPSPAQSNLQGDSKSSNRTIDGKPPANPTLPGNKQTTAPQQESSGRLNSNSTGQPSNPTNTSSSDSLESSLRNFEWPKGNLQDPSKQPGGRPNGDSASKSSNSSIKVPKSALERIQNELKYEGWGKTLERIAKEATGISSGEQLSDARKSGNENPKKSAGENVSRRDTPVTRDTPPKIVPQKPNPPITQAEKPKPGSSWIESATDFISKLESKRTPQKANSSPAARPEQPSAPNTAFSPPTLPDFGAWLNTWTLGFIALLALALGLLIAGRHRITPMIQAIRKDRKDDLQPLAAMEIRDRADVIRAFHSLVERRVRYFEAWWTSRRVMKQCDTKASAVSNPMRVAVEVYEMARYSPADAPIPETELQRVRVALRDCETVESI